MKTQIKLKDTGSYKTGMNEVIGLEAALREVIKPVLDVLNEMDHWSGDDWFKAEPVEYERRDGFIPHSHNCGGLMISAVVPKCGEYDFKCLEFGEYSEREKGQTDEEYDSQCSNEESDGHLDAALRIWLKFEGINADGELEFYITFSGGNGDAPYFRSKYLADIFEASFTAKSVAGVKRAASKHIKALIKAVQGE